MRKDPSCVREPHRRGHVVQVRLCTRVMGVPAPGGSGGLPGEWIARQPDAILRSGERYPVTPAARTSSLRST